VNGDGVGDVNDIDLLTNINDTDDPPELHEIFMQ
jgi:hypothetical protein